jgi:gliding motility-associated-like protein
MYGMISSQSQLCDGNLGENIFSKGDFGRGNPTVISMDPGYAPGFSYTPQVPPDDGEYTITNDMDAWPSSFPAWISIQDNSPDPMGYMMVINASYSPGIFYQQEIKNVCDHTLYEFSADIINLIKQGINGHILPSVSFLIDDIVVYNTGQIPQDEEWHTYGFTFTTGDNQSSVRLTLRNNAPGGVGNDLALDNISLRPCGPRASISIEPEGIICENALFPVISANIESDTGALQWQVSFDNALSWSTMIGETGKSYRMNYQTAGVYYFRYLYSTSEFNLTNPNCRTISDSIRVEVAPVEFTIRDTLCEGLSFNLGGIDYAETGVYQEFLTAQNGCDSIVTLELIIFPDPPILADFEFESPSCKGANDGSISLVSVTGTRPPYIMYVNDSLIPQPSTSIQLPAGSYQAAIENEYGCRFEEEILIPDGPPMSVSTIDDTTIILGHSITLESFSTLPVWATAWTPSIGLNCPTCLSPDATPFQDQLYVITVESETGCIDTDSVFLRVDPAPVIYVPNVFSPNNDGINDFFEVYADPFNISSVRRILIFDRWGGIISAQADLFNEGVIKLWNGYTPRGPANPGTYVYLIELSMADDTIRAISGDVTVVK